MTAYLVGKPEWRQASCDPAWIELVKDLLFVIDGVEYWIPDGYTIDGASIPRAVWSLPGIGSKTDPDNVAGAWPHDALFLTHAVPFAIANDTARQIWVDAGKGRLSARVMWMAVSSPIGRAVWHNSTDDCRALYDVREIIRARADRDKFQSLWFPDKTFD
jgi:hypothetical protein